MAVKAMKEKVSVRMKSVMPSTERTRNQKFCQFMIIIICELMENLKLSLHIWGIVYLINLLECYTITTY